MIMILRRQLAKVQRHALIGITSVMQTTPTAAQDREYREYRVSIYIIIKTLALTSSLRLVQLQVLTLVMLQSGINGSLKKRIKNAMRFHYHQIWIRWDIWRDLSQWERIVIESTIPSGLRQCLVRQWFGIIDQVRECGALYQRIFSIAESKFYPGTLVIALLSFAHAVKGS